MIVRRPKVSLSGMSTTTTPTATRGNAMQTALRVARLVLMGSGAVLLLLGVYIWTGNGDAVIPIHVFFGLLLVLALWTIATIATIAGVRPLLIVAAVAWSLAVPVFGMTQDTLLEGDAHWVIQATHLVFSMALVGWGQLLVIATQKRSSGIGG